MKLTVLGSGTCVPSAKRSASSYLLSFTNNRLLIDCGPGTLRQIALSGVDYRKIDAVFITHLHPDHVSDLPGLVHALLATPGFKRKKPLYLFGPEKLRWFYEDVILNLLREPDEFKIVLKTCPIKVHLFDLDIVSAKTLHSPDSVAYRFESKDKVVVFTGDADLSEELIELASGADLLVADCSFPDGLKKQGHMTPSECGKLANKANVSTLLLSHLYPTDVPSSEFIRQCKQHFSGKVIVAEDLMVLKIQGILITIS